MVSQLGGVSCVLDLKKNILSVIKVAVFTHLTAELMRKNLKQKLFLNSSFSLSGAVMMLRNNQL